MSLACKLVEEWLSNNNFSDKNFINPGWQAQAMDWELYIQKLSASPAHNEDLPQPSLLKGSLYDSSMFGLSYSTQVSPSSTAEIENRRRIRYSKHGMTLATGGDDSKCARATGSATTEETSTSTTNHVKPLTKLMGGQ